jgi:hypothetical protein
LVIVEFDVKKLNVSFLKNNFNFQRREREEREERGRREERGGEMD